jgi:hypothetical protein
MAHITRSAPPEVYHVNTAELRAYLNAGWRLASADEYRVWARSGSGRGQKRAPRAPALTGAGASSASAASTATAQTATAATGSGKGSSTTQASRKR